MHTPNNVMSLGVEPRTLMLDTLGTLAHTGYPIHDIIKIKFF